MSTTAANKLYEQERIEGVVEVKLKNKTKTIQPNQINCKRDCIARTTNYSMYYGALILVRVQFVW